MEKECLFKWKHFQPEIILLTVDKNPDYPIAIQELKEEKRIPEGIQLRQVKYLNNIVEQDHRFNKKRIRQMLGLKSLRTAKRIISGIEAMHMTKKGQTLQGEKSIQNQKNSSINYLD